MLVGASQASATTAVMLLSAAVIILPLVFEARAQVSSADTNSAFSSTTPNGVSIASPGASSVILTGTNPPGSSISNLGGDLQPTGADVSYLSYSTTSTLDGSPILLATTFAAANGSILTADGASTSSHDSSSTTSFSLLQGSMSASSLGTNGRNASATKSSTSAEPVNTTPCNNYPELCNRSYSNITFVAAHNSPFVNPNNAAANQALPVLDQLNDGIRMLQGQTHFNTSTRTISYCHTSCDLLNAGTAEEYFINITSWVRTHPYDVVTLLIGNSDFIGVGNYTQPLINSGLANYAYVPPQVPMNISAWPTLSSMILSQKRVVIFMDYNANQTEVPYILDEFSQMWETPFSPTNESFPCTQQRPPGLDRQQAQDRMYMANHNLNTEISLGSLSLLVPTTSLLNQTNAVSGNGSLGLMANTCTCMLSTPFNSKNATFHADFVCLADWSRPPNFLLVDYYNQGNFPGSVFEVAAQHNNVTYNRPCCGVIQSAASVSRPLLAALLLGLGGAMLPLLS